MPCTALLLSLAVAHRLLLVCHQLNDPHGFGLLELRIGKVEKAEDHMGATVSAQFINAGRLRLGLDLPAEMQQIRQAKFNELEAKRKKREALTGEAEPPTEMEVSHASDDEFAELDDADDDDDDATRLWRLPKWWLRIRPDPSHDWDRHVEEAASPFVAAVKAMCRNTSEFTLSSQAAFDKHRIAERPVLEDKNMSLGCQYKPRKAIKKLLKVIAVEAKPEPPPVVKVWGETYSDDDSDAGGGAGGGGNWGDASEAKAGETDQERRDREEAEDKAREERAQAAEAKRLEEEEEEKQRKKRRKKRRKKQKKGEAVVDTDEEDEEEQETPDQARERLAKERSAAIEELLEKRQTAELAGRRGMVAARAVASPLVRTAWERYHRAAVDVAREVFGSWVDEVSSRRRHVWLPNVPDTSRGLVFCLCVWQFFPDLCDEYMWEYLTARVPVDTRYCTTLAVRPVACLTCVVCPQQATHAGSVRQVAA